MNRPYDGGPMLLANIPSPSRGVIEIGPFELHAYGLMLALGVLAAAKIAEWRWTQWGHNGTRDRRDLHPRRHRAASSARASTTCSPGTTGTPKASPARSRSGRADSRSGARSRAARSRSYIMARIKHLDILLLADAIAPGPRGRAGDRPFGQLLQPGAVRPADEPAVGARDRPGQASRASTSPRTRSTRRSSTSRCGACSSPARSSTLETQARTTPRAGVRALRVACTRSGACSSRRCDPIPRARCSAYASTCCCPRCCASLSAIWFVWLGRRPQPTPRVPRFPRVARERRRRSTMTTTSPTTTTVAARAEQATKIYGARRHRRARARRRRRRVRAGAVHRDHGPVGFRASRRCCTASRVSTASRAVRCGSATIPLGQLSEKELTQGPPRQDRLRVPGVQPHPDVDRDREHHAPDVARRPRSRPGVARSGDRHREPPRPSARTGRPSSPADSSSASRSRVRSRRNPRSSSPTSRPGTSTRRRAPRSCSSCARPSSTSARRS